MQITSKKYLEVFPRISVSKGAPNAIREIISDSHELATAVLMDDNINDPDIISEVNAYYRNLSKWIDDGRVELMKDTKSKSVSSKAAPKKPKEKTTVRVSKAKEKSSKPKATKPKGPSKEAKEKEKLTEKIKIQDELVKEIRKVVIANSKYKEKLRSEVKEYLDKNTSTLNQAKKGVGSPSEVTALKDKLKSSQQKKTFYTRLLKKDTSEFKAIAKRIGLYL